MTTQARKVRKQRGSRTHGWGTSGQHRDNGMRGGHGKAGWCKHKWSYVQKYGIKYGKNGFVCPTGRGEITTLNVGELEHLALKNQTIKPKNGEKIALNLNNLGYEKLLGNGRVTRPFHLTIQECSQTARKKIEEAGGAVELVKDKEKQ